MEKSDSHQRFPRLRTVLHPRYHLSILQSSKEGVKKTLHDTIYTLLYAPYLVVIYAMIFFLDYQYRVDWIPTAASAGEIILFLVPLAIAANAYCYIEARTWSVKVRDVDQLDIYQDESWYIPKRVPRLLLVVFIMFTAIGIGLMVFVLPGIYIMTKFAFAPAIAIVEDAGIRESFRRSYNATTGNVSKILAVYFSVGGIVFVSSLFVQVSEGAVEFILLFVLFALSPVILQISIAHLYLRFGIE